jgi:SH3-like domain-containing protein
MSPPNKITIFPARRALLFGAALLTFAPLNGATAQTPPAAVPSTTLHPPTKKSAPAAAPSAPLAAPRPKVDHAPAPAAAKPPPVVAPKGPVKTAPPAKPGTKPAAKPVSKAPAAAAGAAAGAAAVALPAPVVPAEPTKGTATAMPLPRFASLRSDEVNLRTGPGVRYPIDWVYKRRDLPVQIEREFEVWRLVRDQEGVKGWVHQATLTGRRSFVVTGTERVLRRDSNDTASAVARLQPGVVGRIRSCDAASDWCQLQVGDYKGWLKREEFWGVLPGEAVTN